MSTTFQNTTVGFIGTGVMGKSMAGHLLTANVPMHVYSRTRAKAQDLLDRGAHWADTPAALAPHCDIIFTIVGFYVKHFIKDMTIAAESAAALGLDAPGLTLALSLYRQLAEQGAGDEGTQALFKLYGRAVRRTSCPRLIRH